MSRTSFPCVLASFVLLCLVVSQVLALATEHFGNEPVPQGFVQISPSSLVVANLNSRVYWFEVNGDPSFFYRGNTEAFNEVLEKFARIDAPLHEVILMPGPGETTTLTGEKHIPFNWSFRAPAGLYAAVMKEKGTNVITKHPTLTVYINVVKPATPVDGKLVERWIAQLDDEVFEVRDKATRELEKLGVAAGPVLRQALDAAPAAEKRRRIEALLDRLAGIDLDLLKVPANVTLVEVKDLRARYQAGLKNEVPNIRGMAVGALGDLVRYDDEVLAQVIDVLRQDKHEYVRRSASGVLGRLGKQAAAAVPTLKEGLQDPDVHIRNAFSQALAQIEEAKKALARPGQAADQKALLEQIRRYCSARPRTP